MALTTYGDIGQRTANHAVNCIIEIMQVNFFFISARGNQRGFIAHVCNFCSCKTGSHCCKALGVNIGT